MVTSALEVAGEGPVTKILGDMATVDLVPFADSGWLEDDKVLEVCPDSGRNLGVICLVFK